MDVQIRCICPGMPHEGDTVTLPDVLSFRQTLAVRTYVGHHRTDDDDLVEFVSLLIEAYLLHCIEAWSLQEDGKPVGLTKAEIQSRLMTDANMDVAEVVGDAADTLYSEKVFLPLLKGASVSSPATPTDVSTSPTNGHGSTPRKRSKRSSISTTPTVFTGPMAASPGGASNSSLS